MPRGGACTRAAHLPLKAVRIVEPYSREYTAHLLLIRVDPLRIGADANRPDYLKIRSLGRIARRCAF